MKHTSLATPNFQILLGRTSAILPIILIALCDTTTKIPGYVTHFAEKYFKAHSNFKN